ncbi:hypothetical protein [Actinoplanes rectilineatus]|uniref:hypothetical protein n=1 Tax=Actinoplanes rectilineatus TaxID=113571 RepID=UPI000AFE088B|nr:hypothetical protein [Actinoplanes rectilineatus]
MQPTDEPAGPSPVPPAAPSAGLTPDSRAADPRAGDPSTGDSPAGDLHAADLHAADLRDADPLADPLYPGAEDAGEPWWRFQHGTRRPWRRTLTVTVALAVVIVVLGAGLGLLWAWLAPNVPVIDAGGGGIVVNDPSPEQYIAADGWFTLLGLGFGILVAIAAWIVLRRDRGPFLLLGVIGGTFVAGHWVAPAVGELIGRDAYADWRATAAQGASYLAPPEVHSVGPTLVPAFAAAIVLTLLAGWANDPDLDQPGAHPGYGPNHPDEYPAYGPLGVSAADAGEPQTPASREPGRPS